MWWNPSLLRQRCVKNKDIPCFQSFVNKPISNDFVSDRTDIATKQHHLMSDG